MFYNYSKSNKNFFFDNHAITVSYKNPNSPPPPKKGGRGWGAHLQFCKNPFHSKCTIYILWKQIIGFIRPTTA